MFYYRVNTSFFLCLCCVCVCVCVCVSVCAYAFVCMHACSCIFLCCVQVKEKTVLEALTQKKTTAGDETVTINYKMEDVSWPLIFKNYAV